MKYIAFLRGINVGGKNLVKMIELRAVLSDLGFKKISTYINSGNIIFETNDKDTKKISQKLETAFEKKFKFKISIVTLSHENLKKVLNEVPDEWKTKKDIRQYVSFLVEGANSKEFLEEIELKEGIDSIKFGTRVLYMTTKLSGLTKSRFNKLAGKRIYKLMTIRNYNTCKKVLELMKENLVV